MNKSIKIIIIAVIAILVIWAISAAFGGNRSGEIPKEEKETTDGEAMEKDEEEEDDEEGPITIGFIAPLTGDAAAYGTPLQQIVQMAVNETNEAGGINGRNVEVIYEDGGCEGKVAVAAVQKLINVDNVKFILGGFCSSESLSAEPFATENEVLLFSLGSSSPDLTGISEYFVRSYPSDSAQAEVLATAAFENGWTKVGVIQEQTDYPLALYQAFSDTLVGLGGEVVHEAFATETADFRTTLTQLQSEEPDALFISAQTPAVGERILKQLTDLDWAPQLIIIDVISGDLETIAANAEILEGALAAEFGVDKANPKFQALAENYEAAYGEVLPYQSYAQTEYDGALILFGAIREVGEDSTAVAEWLREVEGWEGASGTVDIDENGDRVGGYTLRVVKDGKVMIHE